MHENVTQKLSWRLNELPAATGLSLAFWRKAVRLGWLPAQKPEGSAAIVILDRDLRAYLESRVRPVSSTQTTEAREYLSPKEAAQEGDHSLATTAPTHALYINPEREDAGHSAKS